MKRRGFDHQILLLQGGGALGAYQAGVYKGLAEGGMAPSWVVGISIVVIDIKEGKHDRHQKGKRRSTTLACGHEAAARGKGCSRWTTMPASVSPGATD
jgi:hypothetical protein